MKDYTTRPVYQRLTKNLMIFAGVNRTFTLKKLRDSPSQMFYKISHFLMPESFFSFFNSSSSVFLRINRNFKNAFTEHLRIGNFQEKHLYWSPVLVTSRGMPCGFIKVGIYQEHFQENIETLFRDTYSRKKL